MTAVLPLDYQYGKKGCSTFGDQDRDFSQTWSEEIPLH